MARPKNSADYEVLPEPRRVQSVAERGSPSRTGGFALSQTLRWRPAWLNYWRSFFMAFASVIGALVAAVVAGSVAKEAGISAAWFPLAGFVLAGLFVLAAAIDRWRRYYELRPDGHIIERYGIIAKSTDEVRVQDIRLLRVKQGIIQRIFRLGDIEIATAGHSDVEIHMRGIVSPEQVKEAIRGLQAMVTTDTRVFSTE